MQKFFADMHIHVGKAENGKWVKMATSQRLTVRNILLESAARKGMDMIGIVDALSPWVLDDIKRLYQEGVLIPDSGGGYRAEGLMLLLGAEIETVEEDGSMAHTLVYLPDILAMEKFSQCMSRFIRNIHLSSQNAHMPLRKLIEVAAAYEAMIVPAHVFTPHKGILGACVRRLSAILDDWHMSRLSAVELGLSADSFMADRIAELSTISFLTNSDAHSLDKIAREYNVITAASANYTEFRSAVQRNGGRHITANYGLDPRLGKYHRTFCPSCGTVWNDETMANGICPHCRSGKLVKGVWDRVNEIADGKDPVHPAWRPPYFYQVPLGFIPGIGKKTYEKLLAHFGTEMNVVHHAPENELRALAGDNPARHILQARAGSVLVAAGGGGRYGRVLQNPT